MATLSRTFEAGNGVNYVFHHTVGHCQKDPDKAKTQAWKIDRLATSYFETLEHNRAKSSKARAVDRNRYANFIKPGIASRQPQQLQQLDVERLRRDLQKTKCTLKAKDAPARDLSPATIRATLNLLKRIINYGGNTGLCGALLFKITMPKVTGVSIEDLNAEQMKKLLAAIEADTNIDARGIMLLSL